MNKYKNFSHYYDEIMTQIDYKDWLDFTNKYLKKDDIILDLACGSGTLINMLKNKGYNVEGLDYSEEMINIARNKNPNIVFYNKDMTSFHIDKKYNVITCFFDSLNHLNTFDEIKKTFNCVYNHLNEKGLFIFDIFSFYAYLNSKGITKKEFKDFSYEWKITLKKPNILKHNLKIKDTNSIVEENYNEYYYPLEKFINDKRFKTLEISGDFLDFYDSISGRLIVVLEKK